MTAGAGLAVEGGQQDEGHTRGRQVALARGAAGRIGIYEGRGGRRLAPHQVVVDDDNGQADIDGGLQRIVGGRAAVEGDDQVGALGGQAPERGGAGSVALGQTVGDVEADVLAHVAEPADELGGRGRAIHVIVGEEDDIGVGFQGVEQDDGRFIHLGEGRGVGKLRLQGGVEEIGCLLAVDAPGSDGPRQGLGQPEPQTHVARRSLIGGTKSPGAPGDRARHAEEGIAHPPILSDSSPWWG